MSFLKILGMGTPQKFQEYTKFLAPGGYNFYWTLQEATRALTTGGKSFTQCLTVVQSPHRRPERECNVAALKSLHRWIKKKKPDAYFQPPVGRVFTQAASFSVKIEPEFGFVKDGQRCIVQIWYSKNRPLSKTAVRLGLRLMEKHLCVGEFADCQVAILDLRKCELAQIPLDAAVLDIMISSEFALVDHIFATYGAAHTPGAAAAE